MMLYKHKRQLSWGSEDARLYARGQAEREMRELLASIAVREARVILREYYYGTQEKESVPEVRGTTERADGPEHSPGVGAPPVPKGQ